MRRLDELEPDEVEAVFARARGGRRRRARARGLSRDAIEFSRQIDMRYVGQSYELTIPTPGRFEASSVPQLLERFHAEHDRSYGFMPPTRADRVREPAPDDGRADREAAAPAARRHRRPRAEGAPPRLLRRVRRLRRLPDLRPVRAAGRGADRRARRRRGVRLDDRHPPRLRRGDRDLRKPDHQEGANEASSTGSSSRRT